MKMPSASSPGSAQEAAMAAPPVSKWSPRPRKPSRRMPVSPLRWAVRGRWASAAAARERALAWNYADTHAPPRANALRTARLAAERAKNPPPQQPTEQGSGSSSGRIDWTKILTDIIIHSMDKG